MEEKEREGEKGRGEKGSEGEWKRKRGREEEGYRVEEKGGRETGGSERERRREREGNGERREGRERDYIFLSISISGEYISLYQTQRESLKAKFLEKDLFIQQLTNEKAVVQVNKY